MSKTISIWVFVFVFIASSAYSANVTTSLNVSNNGIVWDTHVRKDNPTTTQGTADPLNLAINDYSSTEQGRAYVKYNISSAISAGCNVTNVQAAVMRIYSHQNDGFQNLNGDIYNVYDLTWQSETEDTITWNNQVCGTAFDNATACNLTSMGSQTWAGNSEVNYDVTPAIKYAITQGNTAVSLAIKTSETNQAKYAFGRTKEYTTTPSNVHYLNITCDMGANITYVSINYYNLTSNGGCESWNTDRNTACNISSVLPTVIFNTSENAYCAVAAGINSSALNLNYSDMGSSRNCTGNSSGEGAKSHYCTLTLQDELFFDASFLFISCKGISDNQNRTSTSGPLAMNVTGLENTGRNAIEIAVRNSLASGYATYTDQKVYARNSADSQAVGRFDKVIKKLNKIWAFNRVDSTETFVSSFNITPVFYTLEFANKTTGYIVNNTERLINSTR